MKLLLGNEQKISAVVNPENATDKSVTWYSENEGVVTVSDGRITAVGEGTAVVTAKASNGVSASMTVEVLMIEPDSIKTSGDDLRVEMRDTASMDIEILPKDSIDKTYELSEWDDQIVNIRLTNDTVELMPVSEGRTALLIETWNGIEKRIPIEVYSVPMEKIEIDDSEVPYMGDHSIDIENGEFNLNCKIIPENCTYPDVQWKSSDEDVIKVSDGVFQVIGKGTTTITCESVKDDGVYSQIEIQVVDKAEIVMTTVLGAGFLTVGGIVGVRKYKKRKRKSSGDSEK